MHFVYKFNSISNKIDQEAEAAMYKLYKSFSWCRGSSWRGVECSALSSNRAPIRIFCGVGLVDAPLQNGFRAGAVREGEVGQRGDHLGVDVDHRVPPRCTRQLLISAVELVGAGRPRHAGRVGRAAHRVRHLHVRRLGRVAQAEDAATSAGRSCRDVARPPPHVPPAIRGLCRAAVRGSRVRGHTDVGTNIRFGRVRLWVGLCVGGGEVLACHRECLCGALLLWQKGEAHSSVG